MFIYIYKLVISFRSLIMKCSICLETIKKNQLYTNKKYCKSKCDITCGHNFHKDCLLGWFYSPKANSDKCPLCRKGDGTTSL